MKFVWVKGRGGCPGGGTNGGWPLHSLKDEVRPLSSILSASMDDKLLLELDWHLLFWYTTRTRMANLALKCRVNILIPARSLCSYHNILINFGQLYSNSCYTTSSIATLGMCIACEFHQLWVVRPCIYHIFRHLTIWLIFCRIGHACTVFGYLCWGFIDIIRVTVHYKLNNINLLNQPLSLISQNSRDQM